MTSNLLVELLVEELPPKALKQLGTAFAGTLSAALAARGLLAAETVTTGYATPRRLAAHLTNVAARALDQTVAQKLMPAKVGLDAQGKATPALLKKLAALDADADAVGRLRREDDGKSEMLYLDRLQPGITLADGLQQALEETLQQLPIPKVMTYQLADGWESVHFVRPAHGLVALHGSAVVPVGVLGLQSGATTQGHRFEAKLDAIRLADADSYARQLRDEGMVIADFSERRAEIARQLAAVAASHELHPVDDDALLDEVTALVEWPNVLLGQFEPEYLEVPQECLILTMKANQKYFPLLDAQGKLTNKFLIVSNISPADPSKVIGGNERVVRPRLADARFFFDQDRKKTLASRVAGLDKVVYHSRLGSQGERMRRVCAIADAVGQRLGGADLARQAAQAAQLAKADLLTDMVGEFPELQGIMGRYYARHEGLDDAVACAIEDHYKPRFSGDALPRGDAGIALALADKLETLVGMFGIGNLPTGEKDPFALRRHALGVLRILRERALALGIDQLVDLACDQFDAISGFDRARATLELDHFLRDRLAGALRDEGYSFAEVDAVLAPPHGDPAARLGRIDQLGERLAAVRAFLALPESASLAAANKRVGNILKKVEGEISDRVDPALLHEAAEQALHQALTAVRPEADAAFESGRYTASLRALAALRAPVDQFFDTVMVNAEADALRRNRLALLAQLHQSMNRVADLSRLAG